MDFLRTSYMFHWVGGWRRRSTNEQPSETCCNNRWIFYERVTHFSWVDGGGWARRRTMFEHPPETFAVDGAVLIYFCSFTRHPLFTRRNTTVARPLPLQIKSYLPCTALLPRQRHVDLILRPAPKVGILEGKWKMNVKLTLKIWKFNKITGHSYVKFFFFDLFWGPWT